MFYSFSMIRAWYSLIRVFAEGKMKETQKKTESREYNDMRMMMDHDTILTTREELKY